MISALDALISGAAEGWLQAVVHASLVGGVVLSVIWLALRVLPGLAPATRAWLWRLGSAKLICALLLVDGIAVPLLPAAENAVVAAGAARTASEGVAPTDAALQAPGTPKRSPGSGRLWPVALLAAWMLGVGLLGGRLVRQWLGARRLVRGGRPVTDPGIRAELARLSRRLGLSHLPGLLQSDEISGPLVVGWRRPVVLLPASRDGAVLDLLLAHELGHVRRLDLLWIWLPVLGRWLLFFHPLAWLAERELLREQERACDALVLATSGAHPARYAGALLAAARVQPPIWAPGAFPTFARLRERIAGLEGYGRPLPWTLRLAGACLVILALLTLPPWRPVRAAAGLDARPGEVVRIFAADKVKGCFLLAEKRRGLLLAVGGSHCDRPLPPCSTFKLHNAMFAIDSGVLASADERFRWDGRRKPFAAWERDHTLRSAFRHSVVWAFQTIASRIGRERMQRYLDRLGFGNRLISRVDQFWLDGSLRISARGQLRVLLDLYRDSLPLADRARNLGRQLMDQDAGRAFPFGGKTGTCVLGGELDTGWFIGHLGRGEEDYLFVTLIRARDGARGPRAQKLSRRILAALKLL